MSSLDRTFGFEDERAEVSAEVLADIMCRAMPAFFHNVLGQSREKSVPTGETSTAVVPDIEAVFLEPGQRLAILEGTDQTVEEYLRDYVKSVAGRGFCAIRGRFTEEEIFPDDDPLNMARYYFNTMGEFFADLPENVPFSFFEALYKGDRFELQAIEGSLDQVSLLRGELILVLSSMGSCLLEVIQSGALSEGKPKANFLLTQDQFTRECTKLSLRFEGSSLVGQMMNPTVHWKGHERVDFGENPPLYRVVEKRSS